MTTPVRQGDGIQPIGVGVMLVDAKPVIANRFGKFELVEISVVDLVPTHRVIERYFSRKSSGR